MKGNQLSILLVDDEEQILTYLQILLELSDYKVSIACNGTDALIKIHQNNYDIVITDIEMPQMDGLELLARIRKTVDYSLPVILMTGFIDAEYTIKAIRLGASDFIRKPVDKKLLLKTVNSLITGSKITQQIQTMSHQLLSADMEFQFLPIHFLETDITAALTVLFKQYFELNSCFVNEITLCLEEMLNNAFIHGTLKLEEQTRQLDYLNYIGHVKKIITNHEVSSKKIILQAKLNKQEKFLQLSVTDEGNGFDFNPWLNLSEYDLHQNLTNHGRGIALIRLLADDIQFLNEGRTIIIRKKFDNANLELSEIR